MHGDDCHQIFDLSVHLAQAQWLRIAHAVSMEYFRQTTLTHRGSCAHLPLPAFGRSCAIVAVHLHRPVSLLWSGGKVCFAVHCGTLNIPLWQAVGRFRQWWQWVGGEVAWPSDAPRPRQDLTRYEMLERFDSHTKSCPSCSKVLKSPLLHSVHVVLVASWSAAACHASVQPQS